jgi:hypothetical protein
MRLKENHTAGIPRETEDRRPSSAAEEERPARLPSTDERLDTDDERPVRLSISLLPSTHYKIDLGEANAQGASQRDVSATTQSLHAVALN